MGHEYVKRPETFDTTRNGVVPKPSAQEVSDGKVLKADGTWGEGGSQGASSLGDLSDVSTTGAENGDVLTYNGESWEPQEPAPGGVTDVEVDGQSVVDPQTGVASISMPTPPTIPVSDVQVNGQSVVDANKIAQIKSYKEVTEAQYEALPDSKLSDNVMYLIKDIPDGAEGYPPLIYADEEREVGVWRDGKPLYQKTVFIETLVADSNWHTVAHGVTDIDKIIDISGATYHYENGGFWISYALNTYRPGGTMGIVIGVNYSSIEYMNTWVAGHSAYVTFRYTKTTDTPGSGTWGGNGALAHHYSTNEHIIGTWIDGKPLYEKVLQFEGVSNSPAKRWHNLVDVSSLSVDTIVNCVLYNAKKAWYEHYSAITNGILQIYSANDSWGADTCVLQYTKTTD